jgi:hypothetical protein
MKNKKNELMSADDDYSSKQLKQIFSYVCTYIYMDMYKCNLIKMIFKGLLFVFPNFAGAYLHIL